MAVPFLYKKVLAVNSIKQQKRKSVLSKEEKGFTSIYKAETKIMALTTRFAVPVGLTSDLQKTGQHFPWCGNRRCTPAIKTRNYRCPFKGR